MMLARKIGLAAAVVVASCLAFVALGEGAGGDQKKIDLSKPFQHGTHFAQLRKEGDRLLTCSDCHTLSSTVAGAEYPICTKPRMPFPTHDKCTGCHPNAFFTRPLVICTNCHTGVSFTQKVPLKAQTTANAPLRTHFSHKLHLDPSQRVKKRFGFDKDCTFCHTFVRGGEKVLLPAHPQCCDCHTKADVEPNINDCAACHARPKHEDNRASMIKKFSHANHTTDPKTGESLPCVRCHYQVVKADKVKDIGMPVMATCVTCHAGEVAFDYSQCLRCHGPEIEKLAVPESHKVPPPK